MFRKFIFIFLLLFSSFSQIAGENLTLTGVIKNSKNKKALENVSISVPGSNIATVSNADGFFTLKIPSDSQNNGLKFEQIGFNSIFISKEELLLKSFPMTILMDPAGKMLKEVVVVSGDPREIVRHALLKIPENYSDKDNLFSAFYRETVKKGNRFINISEAMVDVLKKPYKMRISSGDKVAVKKGRTLLSPKPSDTLAVKLAGGPYMPVILDVVKNGDHLFTIEEMDNFEFKMEQSAMIDDQMHFAISFKPRVSISYPLHKGTMFIDHETLTISRVEFELDMSDKNKVTRSILQKKPSGLHFKPQEVSGVATYKNINGKSYLNYISSTIRFKCDWKKRLFSSGYTTSAEMVMVDRNDNPDKHKKLTDTFNNRKIFSDIVENYWEEDFWKDYNIIEPTESLEKAVSKLKKQ